jgi:hypothetical protein
MQNAVRNATALAMALLLCGAAATPVRAAASCDRACLEGFVDRYLDAAIAHDPSKVPLAPRVRFTEDGQQLDIGDGMWRTLKAKGKYRLFVTDVPAGEVGFFGSIEEDNREPDKATPAIIALRLKVSNQQITEIEQLVVRDEKAGARLDTLTPNPVYLQSVPAGERMARADLMATSNKYFSGMQQNDGKGDYPFADDCNRLENGNQATNLPTPEGQTRPDPKSALMYSGQWSCLEQFRSGLLHFVHRIRDRRFVALDEERGIALAFTFFDHPGGSTRTYKIPDGRTVTAGPAQPWTWEVAELFKVYGGKIHKIEAVLQRSPYGMLSGWSTRAEGMSDKARDVTR